MAQSTPSVPSPVLTYTETFILRNNIFRVTASALSPSAWAALCTYIYTNLLTRSRHKTGTTHITAACDTPRLQSDSALEPGCGVSRSGQVRGRRRSETCHVSVFIRRRNALNPHPRLPSSPSPPPPHLSPAAHRNDILGHPLCKF